MQRRSPSVTADDRVLQMTSIELRCSVWELFWPLLRRRRLVLARRTARTATRPLSCARCASTRSPSLQLVPSSSRAAGREPLLRGLPTAALGVCGGEALDRALGAALQQRLPGATLVNCYGPTETCIDAIDLAWAVQAADGRGLAVPIGRPIANTQCLRARRGTGSRFRLGGDGRAVHRR